MREFASTLRLYNEFAFECSFVCIVRYRISNGKTKHEDISWSALDNFLCPLNIFWKRICSIWKDMGTLLGFSVIKWSKVPFRVIWLWTCRPRSYDNIWSAIWQYLSLSNVFLNLRCSYKDVELLTDILFLGSALPWQPLIFKINQLL